MENYMRETSVQNVLQRTRIIEDERESADIVNQIRNIGQPIGVDMEGHHGKTVGLVQVKSSDGAIYLFRTGANSKILEKGQLKALLEDSEIIKVFHAGVGDAIVIYKCGVKMVNIYDTALAQLVIEYQNLGRSIHKSRGQIMSFNKICNHYGVTVNPMKIDMKKSNMLWLKEDVYKQPKLPEEMVAYAAYDVEPLLDLQAITASLIEDDYLPVMRDLCDEDIIRNVDPQLLKLKKACLNEKENRTVFINNLNSKTGGTRVNKAEVYELLATHEGMKEVLFSKSSAHITLPSRQSALLLYQSLTENENKLGSLAKPFKNKFGRKAKAALINEADPSEIMAANIETTQALDRMKTDNFIIDNQMIKKLSNILLKTKLAVILDFVLKGEDISLELFTGTHPTLKFQISRDTIENGLGEIFSSKHIVKVVPRLDSNNVHMGIRMAASFGFKPINFFDLNAACNAIDYAVMGQSMFMAPSMPINLISSRFGIETPTKKDDYLYAYLYIVNKLLPKSLLSFLSDKAAIDVELASNISIPEAKEARKKLRLKHEGQCVHVQIKNDGFAYNMCSNGASPTNILNSVLVHILKSNNLKYTRIEAFEVDNIIKRGGGVVGIVQMPYPDQITAFCDIINKFDISNEGNLSAFVNTIMSECKATQLEKGFRTYLDDWGLSMAASKITSKEPARVDSALLRKANLSELDCINRPHLQELDSLGFFDAINEYKS